jgi:hypothetical protein
MKNETILIGAAAAGLIWYFGFGPGKANLNAIATPVPSNLATLPIPNAGIPNLLPPLTSVATNQNTSSPSPGANMQSATGQNPYATIAQQQVLFNWANGFRPADQSAFYAHYPSFTQSEIAGLLDLINTWTTGGPITPARTQFWDTWRVKYSIDIT